MRSLGKLVVLVVLAVVFIGGPVVRVGATDNSVDAVVQWQDGGQPPTVVVEDQSNFDAVWLLALIPGVIAVLAIIAQVIESKNYRQTIESISADNLNKLEGAIEQVPQAVVSQIHKGNERLMDIMEAALATLRVVDKVTDGQPNTPTLTEFTVGNPNAPKLTDALRKAVGDPPATG